MAVEVAVETAVEFQNGCRKKSGSRKAQLQKDFVFQLPVRKLCLWKTSSDSP